MTERNQARFWSAAAERKQKGQEDQEALAV
jgi:hypothetical protein